MNRCVQIGSPFSLFSRPNWPSCRPRGRMQWIFSAEASFDSRSSAKRFPKDSGRRQASAPKLRVDGNAASISGTSLHSVDLDKRCCRGGCRAPLRTAGQSRAEQRQALSLSHTGGLSAQHSDPFPPEDLRGFIRKIQVQEPPPRPVLGDCRHPHERGNDPDHRHQPQPRRQQRQG